MNQAPAGAVQDATGGPSPSSAHALCPQVGGIIGEEGPVPPLVMEGEVSMAMRQAAKEEVELEVPSRVGNPPAFTMGSYTVRRRREGMLR